MKSRGQAKSSLSWHYMPLTQRIEDSLKYTLRLCQSPFFKEVRNNRMMKHITWLCFLIGLGALAKGIQYCYMNDSGHSGFSPIAGAICFIPIIIIGLLNLSAYCWRSLSGMHALLVGALGFLFGIMIHATGIMLQYDTWGARGSPSQNSHFREILIAYAIITLLLLVFTVVFWAFRENIYRKNAVPAAPPGEQ